MQNMRKKRKKKNMKIYREGKRGRKYIENVGQ